MREIKFRGYSDAIKGFVYGDLKYDEAGSTAYHETHPCRISWMEGKANCNSPVRKDSVGQFTGLTDCNGVEIYEGDIIECKFHPQWYERISWQGSHDAVCQVYWDYCGFGLSVKGEQDQRYTTFRELLSARDEDSDLLVRMEVKHSKVIGNIYETEQAVATA
jgi:uncharacterized phage protein (TIGR01671 family)